VKTVADIERMKKHTGCDAVMIGAGRWPTRDILAARSRPGFAGTGAEYCSKSISSAAFNFNGDEDGQRLFRKYAVQYLLLKTLSRDARREILRVRPTAEFVALLNQIYTVIGN